jgi:GT2 family glycosyltransferase
MKIIFCIPGRQFSNNFLKAWTDVVYQLIKSDIELSLANTYDSNVYFVRSKCLGANVLYGKNQKPFQGQYDYDYIMWIDSDQVFSPGHISTLINHKKDIISGVYLMDGGKAYAAVEHWDTDHFKKTGSFHFLTPEDIKDKKELMEVTYAGMGFMLVKKGVFESLEYPWFPPIEFDIGNDIKDFCSEDVGFCLKAREAGYKIWIDPSVRVGHEKSIIY